MEAHDLSSLQVGDRIKTADGGTHVVSDLSKLPGAVGVPNRGPSRNVYPVTWWPAATIFSSPDLTRRRQAPLLPVVRNRFQSAPTASGSFQPPTPRFRLPGPPAPSVGLQIAIPATLVPA